MFDKRRGIIGRFALFMTIAAAPACGDDTGGTTGGGGGGGASGSQTTSAADTSSSTGTGSDACEPGTPVDTVSVDAVVPLATGIDVVAGEELVFRASGTWCWGVGDGAACPDANGTPGRPLPDELPVVVEGAPFGMLGGSVDDEVFAIGTCATIVMPADGELVLFMSDRVGFITDNSGAVDVTIERAN